MPSAKKNASLRRGSAVFRPRARIIRTIGRDLITNEVIALQELIKNAYDADAKKVKITFEDPLTPGHGAIVVADDGNGMTLDIIRSAWMEPATISKVVKTKSRKGRRVTGEKGIGRFASARVARLLEITTVPRDGRSEVYVRFDWGAFDDQSAYLDEIRCKWRERQLSKRAKSGTTLRLTELHDEWKEDKDKKSFSEMRAQLSRLVSPGDSPDKFEIELIVPQRFSEFGGIITPPAILGRPHYRLSGRVDGRGTIHAMYSGPTGEDGLQTEEGLLEDGKAPEIILQGHRKPACGPFDFEFRVWDRGREDLEPLVKELGESIRDLRRDLDAASGVSIYRDRFRVLVPENEDWLRLDLRRVQNPTLRLSNNQIVGTVLISADRNKGLTDQSNRQGIVDSPAFDDFKASVKEVLSKLEAKRDSARRTTRPSGGAQGVFQRLDLEPIRAYLAQRYPNDSELRIFLEQRAAEFKHGIVEVQQVVARYRRLATLGQLVDVILHEGRTPIATISNEMLLMTKDLGRKTPETAVASLPARVQTVQAQVDLLSTLFKRISPFSGRKRGRPVEITLQQVIQSTFALHDKRMRKLGVNLIVAPGATKITADEAELQMIFLNLLENALYWLEKVPEGDRKVEVDIRETPNEVEVIFSDSGPGVPEEVRSRIFDPYFSMKPDGVGLGLTIAGETAAEYDGRLELLADGPLSGATFRVVLRKGG